MTTLYNALSSIEDHRRAEGRRFSFPAMVEMIILAGMSGRFGINSISRFIKNNSDYFIERYGFEHGVPSQTGVFNFLRELEFDKVNKVLIKWMKQYVGDQDDVWVSIDGKVMCSTVEDKHGNAQNYKVIVSAFCNDLQIVIDSGCFANKTGSESDVARQLINKMEVKGVIFTFDAHHCQKKRLKPSWWKEMTL